MNITLQFRGVCGGRKWRLQKIAFDEALKPRKQVVKGYESNISTPPTDVNLHSTNFFNLNHILKRINVEPESFTQQQGLYVLGTITTILMSFYVQGAVICLASVSI